MNTNYLSTLSIFRCSKHVRLGLHSGPCFYRGLSLFKRAREKHRIKWTVYVRPRHLYDCPPPMFERKTKNYAYLNLSSTKKYLDEIRTYVDFRYSIKKVYLKSLNCIERVPKGSDLFWYAITIKGNLRKCELKFILTSIRYLYEAPYSFILLEALRIRSIFPDEHLMNLINLVSTTAGSEAIRLRYRYDQCLMIPYKQLTSIEDIKERLTTKDKISSAYLSVPYEKRHKIDSALYDKMKEVDPDYGVISDMDSKIYSEEFWFDTKVQQFFTELYKICYEVLKA